MLGCSPLILNTLKSAAWLVVSEPLATLSLFLNLQIWLCSLLHLTLFGFFLMEVSTDTAGMTGCDSFVVVHVSGSKSFMQADSTSRQGI